MDGTGLAFGAVAALAAAVAVRRGSRSTALLGPRHKRVLGGRMVWEPITADELIGVFGNAITGTDADVQRVAHDLSEAMESGRDREVHRALRRADEVLGTFGVEHIKGYGIDYLNTGKTYDTTLIWNGDELYFGDWGTIVEEGMVHEDDDEVLECEVCGTTSLDEEFANRTLCAGCYYEQYGEYPR